MAGPTFKANLSAGQTILSSWLTLPSAMIADMLAGGGWGAVVVDMQHGYIGYDDMVACVAAVRRAGCAAIVRVPVRDEGMIGRAMDAGAEGVICPMINSGQEASWFAKSAKYPPVGQRSWAPAQAMNLFGLDKQGYLERANDLVVSMAMVETRLALNNIDSICSTPGIDMIFVGPNDLSVSLSEGKVVDPSGPEMEKSLRHVIRKCDAHGVFAGIFANSIELARTYREMGFRLVNVATDASFLQAGSNAALTGARN